MLSDIPDEELQIKTKAMVDILFKSYNLLYRNKFSCTFCYIFRDYLWDITREILLSSQLALFSMSDYSLLKISFSLFRMRNYKYYLTFIVVDVFLQLVSFVQKDANKYCSQVCIFGTGLRNSCSSVILSEYVMSLVKTLRFVVLQLVSNKSIYMYKCIYMYCIYASEKFIWLYGNKWLMVNYWDRLFHEVSCDIPCPNILQH